jgi:hypothetical protein
MHLAFIKGYSKKANSGNACVNSSNGSPAENTSWLLPKKQSLNQQGKTIHSRKSENGKLHSHSSDAEKGQTVHHSSSSSPNQNNKKHKKTL